MIVEYCNQIPATDATAKTKQNRMVKLQLQMA